MGFYLPCIACTTASWLQFWMAQTAVGDRACLGITTVLTEIFLLEFSNQGMPKVSYMKAAELFLIVSFSFIFLALVESAIVYKATFWSALKEKKNKRVKKVEEPGETQKVMYMGYWPCVMAGYWSSYFCVFMDLDSVSVHKLTKKGANIQSSWLNKSANYSAC